MKNIVLIGSIWWTGIFILPLYAEIDPKQEKVLICGVGKNIAFALPNMITKIEKLGTQFCDYRVIIYQNNSTDETEDLLYQWAQCNKKIIILSETLTPEKLYARTKSHSLRDKSPCRMELIAYGRNEVLKRSWEREFDDFRYLVMTDLDFTVGWDVPGVISSFLLKEPWDCVTANGVKGPQLLYYDRYAYRSDELPCGPELLGGFFWKELKQFPILFQQNMPPLKIYSGFGGIAIYRREALKGSEYSGCVTENLETFVSMMFKKELIQHTVHYKEYKKSFDLKNMMINGDLPIKFKANTSYDEAVVCEHVTLHASMFLRGYGNIYMNPAMICSYPG